jgi:hypothetical protein
MRADFGFWVCGSIPRPNRIVFLLQFSLHGRTGSGQRARIFNMSAYGLKNPKLDAFMDAVLGAEDAFDDADRTIFNYTFPDLVTAIDTCFDEIRSAIIELDFKDDKNASG